MTRSSSAEPAKGTKRKGTRSVSTLNPAQLARKRANDREAQRAIRARTKEHIERLEQQLADLQSERGGDQSQTIQELTRRNRALEEEIYRLREAAGQPTGHSYPNSVYDDNLSSVSGAIPSPRSSPFPASGGYSGMPELGPSYVPLPDASESWGPGVSVPSNVSSPSSSANTDEYGGAYIPTSIPAPMMEARSVPAKMDYDDVDSGKQRTPTARWLPSLASSQPGGRQRLPASRAMEYVPGPVLPAAAVSPLIRQPGTSFWEMPSLVLAPTCAADQWIISFAHDCRRLAQTKNIDALLRPPRVNLKTLLEYKPPSPTHPAPRIHIADLERALDVNSAGSGAAPHPLAELITALVDKAGMANVVERLALFLPAQRILAWLAQPTRESYNALVLNYAPRPSQLTVPHPQWVDFVLQGPLRDAIIERQDVYATEEFQNIYANSLRLLNWPGRPVDAINMDPTTGEVWLNDTFAAHALRIENWRMHETFVRRYPELRGFVELTES
ncbi:conserved hypothetical protein [Verticillium alfalfae VaMs.102]|uniref:BZIP transcription factor n=1 Tax=Verticillium alfalfae (strain VaMs.102 / ATCC MYA-4576 / FGSC 10136) TaxID=526221 RepID=C9SGX0_VERA1|nr:conserved hypothetical protein [Verticillium alfalfae VaMs.102]EEY18190.1 conserved hypothetical protein [Verticillium alfalfae VaMs.102]